MKIVIVFFVIVVIVVSIHKALNTLNALINSLKFQVFGELFNHVDTEKKVVALTYDDGPNPPYTNQLLELLDRYHIKATFFVIGKTIEKYPETVQLIVSKGHELGNHSYSHNQMIFKNPWKIWSEIENTDKLLRQLGVKQQIHFRAPFARKLLVLPYILAKLHKKNILWDVDSKDYEATNSEIIEKNVLEQVSPGSIILMHDGGGERSRTVVATERLIKKLREKGYTFKTISELLYQTVDHDSVQTTLSNQVP